MCTVTPISMTVGANRIVPTIAIDVYKRQVVTGGNANQVIILPKMDKVIGMLDYVDVIAGGHAGSLRPDGTIEAEIQVITSATNEMGFGKLSAR